MTTSKISYNQLAAATLAALALAVLLVAPAQQTHSQGAGTHITGTAWSDAIGWIRLNCAASVSPSLPSDCANYSYNFGVGSGGAITGYAWSDKGGWITANNTGASDAGACGAQAAISGSTVTGWLRQINIPGTDGCIKLNPTGSLYNGGSGDVKYSAGTISGYGWGGDILGWVGFNASANLTPPACTGISAQPSQVYTAVPPANITITYTISNPGSASSAVINPGSVSINPNNTSATVSTPAATTPYQITVTDAVGGGTSQCPSPTTVTVTSGYPPPSGNLSIGALTPVVKAASAKKGSTAALYWDVVYISPNTCAVTQNGAAWKSGGRADNTMGTSTGALTQRTEYVLTCTPLAGGVFTDRAVINIIPEFQEI